MIKKTLTYEDLEGNMVTEDFYFHLRQTDLLKIEAGLKGNFIDVLGELIKSGDNGKMLELLEEVIGKAFGLRVSDTQIDRDPVARQLFLDSPAFDALIISLGSDKAASEFLLGVLPKSMGKDPEMIKAMETKVVPSRGDDKPEPVPEVPPWVREDRHPTDRELMLMSHEQLVEAFQQSTARRQRMAVPEAEEPSSQE